MTSTQSNIPLSVAGGCCVLALLWTVGSVLATVVSVLDLVGGRTHLAVDIVLLVIFWGGFARGVLSGVLSAFVGISK